MTSVGPLTIPAHNRDQAEYLIRSRAQQRGVKLNDVVIEDSGTGTWAVTVSVDDDEAAQLAAASLEEDTTVMHFRNHPHRPRPEA